jgi:hypothetical protein
MRRLGYVLVIVIVGLVVGGYFRDWYAVDASGDDHKTNVNLSIDRERVHEDVDTAVDKVKEWTGH